MSLWLNDELDSNAPVGMGDVAGGPRARRSSAEGGAAHGGADAASAGSDAGREHDLTVDIESVEVGQLLRVAPDGDRSTPNVQQLANRLGVVQQVDVNASAVLLRFDEPWASAQHWVWVQMNEVKRHTLPFWDDPCGEVKRETSTVPGDEACARLSDALGAIEGEFFLLKNCVHFI